MSLQNMDDMDGAIGEVARVLGHGGRFCLAVVHPFNSAGRFAGDDASSPFVVEGSYFERGRYSDNFVRDGLEMTFVSERRPIEAYVSALADAVSWSSGSVRTTFPTRASCGREAVAGSGSRSSLHIRALKP